MKKIIVILNNAIKQKKQIVKIKNNSQNNKNLIEFLNILENGGFIEYWNINSYNTIDIKLKYDSYGLTTFFKINIISKKNNPIFLNTKDLWKNSSNNFIILYTIKGLLSQDEARLLNIGGLAFCNIQ